MKKYFLSPDIELHDFKDGFPRYKKNNSILPLSSTESFITHYYHFLKTSNNYIKFIYFIINDIRIDSIKNPVFQKITRKFYHLILKNSKYIPNSFFSNFISSFNNLEKMRVFISEEQALKIVNTNIKNQLQSVVRKESQEKIENICISSRNRPETLFASLQALNKHLIKHNRTPNIIVLDDSNDPLINQKYREYLVEIKKKFKGKIFLIDKESRLQLVEKIYKKTSIDKTLLKDSLIGLENTTNRLGAARNCLLLKSLNKYSLQIDDDVFYEPKNTATENNTISLGEPQHWKFFGDVKEANDYFYKNSEVNLLKTYEEILNKTTQEIILDKKILLGYANDFLKGDYTTPIQFVCAGGYGDSYFRTPYLPYILQDHESMKSLTKTKKFFYNNKDGAYLSWYQNQTSIVSGAYSVGMNMAIDKAKNLPPFLPDGIEDGSLGLILHAKNKDHKLFKLPVVLKHKRPRPVIKDELNYIKSITSSNILFVTFMIEIISEIKKKNHLNITDKEIGDMIISRTQQLKDFIEFEEKYFRNFLQERKLYTINNIIEFENAPAFFKRELVKYKKNIEKLLEQNKKNKYNLDYFLFDIEGETYSQRMDKLRIRILNYGNLLLHWETIKNCYNKLEGSDHFTLGKEITS